MSENRRAAPPAAFEISIGQDCGNFRGGVRRDRRSHGLFPPDLMMG
jgi:hypothetical protein